MGPGALASQGSPRGRSPEPAPWHSCAPTSPTSDRQQTAPFRFYAPLLRTGASRYDPVFVRGSFCARHVASSTRVLLGGGRKSICTLQGSRVCSFPGQVGFGAERGFRATGAVSGSQDPLRGSLVAGQMPLEGRLSLLGLSPDPEPRTDGLSSRLERRDVNVVELLRQISGCVFENPSLGVLDYRGLGTNFRDYAIVFTQLEFKDEAFHNVELYSRTELASQEALCLFARWSKDLGFLSQQQATQQPDRECHPMPTGPRLTSAGVEVPPGRRDSGRAGVGSSTWSHLLLHKDPGLQGRPRLGRGRGQSVVATVCAGAHPHNSSFLLATCVHKAFQVRADAVGVGAHQGAWLRCHRVQGTRVWLSQAWGFGARAGGRIPEGPSLWVLPWSGGAVPDVVAEAGLGAAHHSRRGAVRAGYGWAAHTHPAALSVSTCSGQRALVPRWCRLSPVFTVVLLLTCKYPCEVTHRDASRLLASLPGGLGWKAQGSHRGTRWPSHSGSTRQAEPLGRQPVSQSHSPSPLAHPRLAQGSGLAGRLRQGQVGGET
ncbi:PREDICTED: uncharacterized protein LOC101375245 [Odobenus rosmarus divergens]|uniref:Uncharacterized protein LOC101375245 n=1 Tax=Odobenus rosmarus divergens TaxID=9708 RepID=A0A9B0M3W2_ODORO